MSQSTHSVIHLSAGPCSLPESVLHEACKGLLNFNGTGIGIAEIGHRSPEFGACIRGVESLEVPQTHSILFVQGGGALQFSVVILNLLARHRLLYPDLADSERIMDYVLTGWFSSLAARRQFSPDPAFIFYCENDTQEGVQFSDGVGPTDPTSFPFHLLPKDKEPLPLVADYSSSFMSRRIPNLANHAVIFASAQKKSLGGMAYFDAVNNRKAKKVYAVIKEGEEKGVWRARVEEGRGAERDECGVRFP
ncbi:hypothetical protein MVEN_00549900 [Mycena venus]|uniref:Phosphoserine transaminase n=1 Tax=Mycena venus TaxID=2733690 RepID=A0A8H6YQF3_9AGAR|nr:hypothetical protein MVEN_00549900 [Mycena venus]